MSLLKVTDLKVSYGGIEALKGVSFAVKEGEIVTLIGANGAGKSTTLRAISGLVNVKGGTIEFAGEDITGMDPQKVVSKGIAMVPEGRRVFAGDGCLQGAVVCWGRGLAEGGGLQREGMLNPIGGMARRDGPEQGAEKGPHRSRNADAESCRRRRAAGGGELQVAGRCRWRGDAGGGEVG